MRLRLTALLVTTGLLALVAVPTIAGYLSGRSPALATPVPPAHPLVAAAPVRASGQLPAFGIRSGAAPAAPLATVPGLDGSIRATRSSSVALTFDDGPNPQWTPKILALLAQYHIKATFCLIGLNVQAHPALVRQIVAAGHTLCNHTWTHNESLGKLSPAAIRADLTRTSNAIHAAAPGAPIAYFRQPGGFWTQSIVDTARSLGMRSLGWDVDPRDWSIPPVPAIEQVVVGGCQPGNIILMHDGGGDRSHTFQALSAILPSLVRSHTFIPFPVQLP